jgi:hypothetical protein
MTPVFVTGGIFEVVYAAIRRGETATLPDLEPDLTRLAFRAYLYPKEWEQAAREEGAG